VISIHSSWPQKMIRFTRHGYSMRRFTAGVVVGDEGDAAGLVRCSESGGVTKLNKVGLPCIACARVNQKFFFKEWCQSSRYGPHANAFLHAGSTL
jgi:hypothetical protein